MRLGIGKKAIEMGITKELDQNDINYIETGCKTELEKLAARLDLRVLSALMNTDIGQFQILPDFIASLHKQIFIASYFLGNRDFTLRGPGSEKPDAFTLEATSREEIAEEAKKSWIYHPQIWVKGTDPESTFYTLTANQMSDKAYKAIANPDIRTIDCRH
jgi:hypothetical protein